MEPTRPDDIDRSEWDRAFADQRLRRLATPARIDVRLFPEWGEPTAVEITAVPGEFVDRFSPRTETCPVCGTSTSPDSRVVVSLYPTFSNGTSIGIAAWAHVDCFATCEELPGPGRIPW